MSTSRSCLLLVFVLSVVGGTSPVLGQTATLPGVSPPAMDGETQQIPLPASLDDLDVGGGGRYIALHFKTLRKIGIFDVNQLKITHYVAANEDDTKFAAGATKLLTVSGDKGVISRWDLATGERELSQTIKLDGPATHALLGSASDGPAIVGSGQRSYDGAGLLVDLATLKSSALGKSGLQRGFGEGAQVRISANGNVLGIWATGVSPSGLQSVVRTGDQWVGRYEHDSVGYIVPSPDGRILYTARGLYTNQLRRTGAIPGQMSLSIPGIHGPFYLTVQSDSSPRQKPSPPQVQLKLVGDDRPLAVVPHLEQVLQSDDNWSRQVLTIDKRLLLIPDAKLILQVSNSKDELVAVRFDIDAALEASDVEYLIVTSRPPLGVSAGDPLSYQIEAKTSGKELQYQLDSGPDGMKLSPTGLLTWTTDSNSPASSQIIVSISDDTGQQAFHSFPLNVAGGNDKPTLSTPPASPPNVATTGAAPQAIVTSAADVGDSPVEIELPGAISDLAVAGNGRFVLLHLKELRKVAVFDVSEGKIVHYFSANDDDTKVVGGATRVLIFSQLQGVVSRYRLDNFQRDLTVTTPFAEPIQYVGMGGGSEGPALVRTSSGSGALASVELRFLDLETLRPLEVTWSDGHRPHGVYRDRNAIRASMDGSVFVVDGMGAIRLAGSQATVTRDSSNVGLLPSANGRFYLANGRLLSSELKPLGDNTNNFGAAVHSLTGSYMIGVDAGTRSRFRNAESSQSRGGKLYQIGDQRPLVTIPDLLVSPPNDRIGGYQASTLSLDKRVLFVPEAKVIVTVPYTDDRLRVLPFDVQKALDASGVDYLIVDPAPQQTVALGKPYEYTLSVKSKRGGLKFTLDAGPEGMKVSSDGKVTWDVPGSLTAALHPVIISVSDASGQSTFHTFEVTAPEVARRAAELAAAEE
ncbi:MAG: hypothetical protein KDB14_11640, partial [Planctomycetales bacterium]|nr:hypothetical protein [Planctomycetales bacterium]